ncbi:uncharacterized protein LOC135474013 isoform X2 [Liolophura sinensis]|uniref:uncharacterized protein LOC135474013 isoform X2 n=1 Tax=Liolophura sinensis TaxID=3198878 RepID=UPI0031583D38
MMAGRKQGPGFSGQSYFVQPYPEIAELLRRRQDTANIRRAYFELHSSVSETPGCKSYRQRRAYSAVDVERRPSVTLQRRDVSSARARLSGRHHGRSNDKVTEYDALTRTFVRLPKLHGQRPPSSTYQRRNIREWQNEVTKVVPKRPTYSLKAHIVSKERAQTVPARPVVTSSTLFHCVNRHKTKGKDYVIYPDWVSEGLPRCQGRFNNVRQTVHLAWG